MKIAMPHNGGQINQHFGQSKEFIVFEVDGAEIKGSHIATAENMQHNHNGLAGLLRDEGVDVVVVGGIGGGMLDALEHNGFKVYSGISGNVEDVARACARGELVSQRVVCGHHHGHHGQNQGHRCNH